MNNWGFVYYIISTNIKYWIKANAIKDYVIIIIYQDKI